MRFGEERSMSPECAEAIVALDSTLRGIVGRSKERQCSWDTAQSLQLTTAAVKSSSQAVICICTLLATSEK